MYDDIILEKVLSKPVTLIRSSNTLDIMKKKQQQHKNKIVELFQKTSNWDERLLKDSSELVTTNSEFYEIAHLKD